jgi:hypothetical protein
MSKFEKGHIPYNKGKKRGSVSPATEFQKGRCPHNTKGDYEPQVIHRGDGTIEVIVSLPDKKRIAVSRNKQYVTRQRTSYARFIWEKYNGEIPSGMIVFNTGDPTKIEIDNLELITRAELLRRNRARGLNL